MIAAVGFPLVLALSLARSYAAFDVVVLLAVVFWFDCAWRTER